MIDAHVYCLSARLRRPELRLPANERAIQKAIYDHVETPYALSLASPASILHSMNEAGIDHSVLVAFPWANLELCQENNDAILEATASNNRFLPLCSVQPLVAQAFQEVERVLKAGALGIKINPAWQGFFLHDTKMDMLAECIIQHNAFLMIHTDHPYKHSPASPAHIFDLASRWPKLKILATHLGGLLGISALHAPVAHKLQNVWFDTAISSTLEMVCFSCQAGASKKIVFGSDYPFNHSHSQKQVVEGLRNLQLTSSILTDIFEKNFLRLTGISFQQENIT